MTTISIAMATYNGEKFIREQLNSLAAQVYLPSELIVTDDGSNDKTLDIIADFSRTAPFSVLIHPNTSRLNYRENFMRCASRCSGDLIAFCDQDDIWDPDKLATLVEYFDRPDVDLVFHDFRLIDADGNQIADMASDLCPVSVDPWTNIRGLTIAFRRKLLKYSELWELSIDQFNPAERMGHDQWYLFLAHSFNSYRHISQPLLSYRQHGANLYGAPSSASAIDAGIRGNLTVVKDALFGRPQLAQAKRGFLYQHLLGRGLASSSKLKVLEEISQREKLSRGCPLEKQIKLYSTFEHSYLPRALIYKDKKITVRLWFFLTALNSGSYSSSAQGVKNALLDFYYGVVLRPSDEPGDSRSKV